LAVIDEAKLDRAALVNEEEEAKSVLAAKMRGASLFGFKNPRTSILMPFWRRIFEGLELDDRYVIALRNPLEVAASLKRRNSFATTRSLLLWTKHLLSALQHTEGKQRVVVSYEALMQEPERELGRIAEGLGLPSPKNAPEALKRFCEEFLDDRLKRFSFGLEDLKRSNEAPDFVIELYSILLDLAALPGSEPPAPSLDALAMIGASYEALDPMLRYADFYEEHFASAVDRMTTAEAKLDDVDRAQSALAEDRDQLKADLADAQETIADRDEAIAEWRAQARTLQSALNKAQETDKQRQAALAKWAGEARGLQEALNAAQQLETERQAALTEWAAHARQLEAALKEARKALKATRRSFSWRVTAPLRASSRVVRALIRALRAAVSLSSRGLWRLLPLPAKRKEKLRDAMFTGAPSLFSWSATYRQWRAARETKAREDEARAAGIDALRAAPEYRPLTASEPPADPRARLVAFYLPQFHAIPENDAWWGKGFTEWTNVRPATPLFDGHLQPRVPGEFGYYDLVKEPQVRRRQAELARLHGVEAFCFYFYWFAGKRLLEQPIIDFAEDSALDFPFCLCWANERWTRRWCGEDASVLIGQDHSPADDLAFIAHLARYLKNPRYLRIDGKPLLIVYRPAHLPSARETGERWRRWCRENGVGEIFIAYTLSFPAGPPAEYGFDAAIEFPPNNSGVPLATDRVTGLDPEFEGKIYDWTALVKRSENYPPPAYKLFRGVNPSWDNSARRRKTPAILLGSNPADYRRWLANAVADTKARFSNPQERLIFVNAWNEWAEGAYLEPDAQYGYAFLEATRAALASSPKRVVVV
ncbi:MAG: glycoside hydrolase family 99-like domain-containing protein, partial [Parvularculaceae bacterium]